MIPVFRPSFDDQELEALRELLRSGWASRGPKTAAFERAFGAFSVAAGFSLRPGFSLDVRARERTLKSAATERERLAR